MADNEAKQEAAFPIGATTAQEQSSDDFWAQQYKEATGGNAQFLFFKEENTALRLIGIGPRNNWFRDVDSNYQGKISPRKMVLGYQVLPPGSKEEMTLQGVIVTPTLWGKIAQAQMTGWDFFSIEKGHGINVTRQKSGRRIDYGVIPSPKPLPVPLEMVKAAEETDWDVLVEAYNKMQESKGDSNAQQFDDKPSGQTVADQIINANNQTSTAPW